MPLMPMPPIPTKCIAPRLAEHVAPRLPSRRQRQRAIDDHAARRPAAPARAPRSPSRRARSRSPPAPEFASPARRRSARAASSTSAAPACAERLGVLPLVVVGRRRQRHQNRRLARRRQSPPASSRRRGRRPRRPSVISPVHVVEERLDLGLEPGAPVGGAHHLQISLSRLVRDRKTRCRRPPAAALPPPWPR